MQFQEICELNSLVTRLQSQHEKGEAARQSLEYDLVLVKKKLMDVTRATTHKEVSLAKQTIQLSGEIKVIYSPNDNHIAPKTFCDI